MIVSTYRGSWWVLLTFLVALVLLILPLPLPVRSFYPDWYALCLLYWVLLPSQRVGMGMGWCLGLILDGLQGGVLGQNAFVLSLLVFLCLRLRARILVFSIWQQAVVILILLLVMRLSSYWIMAILGYPPVMDWRYWTPALAGALVWPCLWMCRLVSPTHAQVG